jgi:hypothetical protein
MEVDPRVGEAMVHVQKAGLELIAAMRNALDVAEDLLGDPQAIAVIMRGAVEAARAATEPLNDVAERVQRIRVDD